MQANSWNSYQIFEIGYKRGVLGARPPEFRENFKINTEFGQIWVLFGQNARMKSQTARKMPPCPPAPYAYAYERTV